ncbi:hypothetical protein [Methanobrevibacter sp.]|uniref:hypothetical protein n=1 Tax=Methanobrevibacter sp. TaxID=66852 RepID=UPI00388EC970
MKNTNNRLCGFTVDEDDFVVKAILGDTLYQCSKFPTWGVSDNQAPAAIIGTMNDTNIADTIVPDDTIVTFLDYSTVGTPSISVSITGDENGSTISELLEDESKKLGKVYMFGEIDDTHYYCVCELGDDS